VPWCQGFPYSLFKHPQYVGTLLSIWGFFLLMAFPHDGWYLIPMLETVYYTGGAYFEQ
jgi:protein-S-isoprenylcysteine O-methyltransferase Ste14